VQPTSVRVGKYEVNLEQRGLRLSRFGESNSVSVRPFLGFFLTEAGKPRVPFMLSRIAPVEGGAEVVGTTSERVAISIRLSDAGSLDGLTAKIFVQNATAPMQLRVTAELVLSGEAEPRWMIPGLFYGENRHPACKRTYPTYSDLNRDLRRFLSNSWAFRSDRAATPLVCAWTYGCFAWLATESNFGRGPEAPSGVGTSGLRLSCEDGQPVLGGDFPYQEAPVKYSFCHDDKNEPEEVFLFLPAGTVLQAQVQVGIAPSRMDEYARVIRGWYLANQDANPVASAVPSDFCEHAAHTGLLRWHYDGRNGAIYETTSFDFQPGKKRTERDPAIMHLGWMSGAMPAYTLLRAGRESNHAESVTAATAVFNRLTSQLAPAGTLFPAWTEEAGWACSFGPDEGTAHSRTVADAVHYLLKALALELEYNASHAAWFDAAVSSLSYAMGAQREDGALPAYYDLSTGSATSYEGCAGMAWIAPMANAAALLHQPHYRDVAIRAGDYYATFLESNFLYGSIEDQPLVPTCDDAVIALIGYLALYETDRELRWLNLARKAADLALSWRFTYNVEFSPHSLLGAYGVRTRGGDIGSVASPLTSIVGQLAYAELARLSVYLGDHYYSQRADDGRAFATQLVAVEDGHYNARASMVIGHFNHTDFLQPKGTVGGVALAQASTLLKMTELHLRALDTDRAAQAPISGEELLRALGEDRKHYADVASGRQENAAVAGAFPDMGSGIVGMLGLTNLNTPSPISGAGRASREEVMPPKANWTPRGPADSSPRIPSAGGGGGNRPQTSFPSGADNPIAAMLGLGDSNPRRTPLPTRGPGPGPAPSNPFAQPEPPANQPGAPPPSPFGGKALPKFPGIDDEGGEEVEIKYKIF
jgi:hypothetical protein